MLLKLETLGITTISMIPVKDYSTTELSLCAISGRANIVFFPAPKTIRIEIALVLISVGGCRA